jgi:hypothetical protein
VNIESIKSETEEYYKSEGQEEIFNIKLENFKVDILNDFKNWQRRYPKGSFEEFKQNSYREMNGFIPDGPNLSIGIYMKALDLIDPKIDLK